MSYDEKVELFLKQYSLEDVLSGVIEMQMLMYGNGEDSLIAGSEYLASNAIAICEKEGAKPFLWSDYLEMEKICESAFLEDTEKIIRDAFMLQEASDEEKEKFLASMHMKVKSMAIRGDGYIHQLIQFAERMYLPFDDEMKNVLGFSFSSCLKLVLYLFQTTGISCAKVHADKYKFLSILKSIGKPLELPGIKNGYVYRLKKEELNKIIDSSELANICDYLAINACDNDVKKVSINDFKMLVSKPFVDFGEYIYMPLLFTTIMNLPKLFHYTFVAEKRFSKKTIAAYTKHRGDLIEELTVKYFEKLVNKDNIYHSLKYLGEDGEADVTVEYGDVNCFCECKSKILTLNSLKGITESLNDDIYKAIGYAYEQAIKSINWVEEGKAFLDNGTEVRISTSKKNYIICVTAENFGIIPSEINKYVTIDEKLKIIPYVVNIYDLEIVTNECKTIDEFWDYLDFRIKNADVVTGVDELDVFGFYKKRGNIQINVKDLMIQNYTYEFDRKYSILDKERLKKDDDK